MDVDRILGTFKFGARAHIEQFAQGLLYMNTLEYFVKLEELEADLARNDSDEGTSHIVQGRGAMLQMKAEGEFKSLGTIWGPMCFRNPDILRANVFCMHALRASASHTLVDLRNDRFGDTFAVVIQHDEFMRRVKDAVLDSGHELQYGVVEYVTEGSYEGPMGIFRKSSRFSYQSEFRMAMLPGTGAAYPLHVGDLSNIVKVGPLSDLNHRLIVVPADASGAEVIQVAGVY